MIGSLWPIEDELAAETFSEFYSGFPTSGAIEALCESRRALRQRVDLKGYDWASFKVMGWDFNLSNVDVKILGTLPNGRVISSAASVES